MSSDPVVSRPVALTVLGSFLAMGVISVGLPIADLVRMVGDLHAHRSVVLFDKGVYYLFGVGISLLVLLIDGFNNAVLRRKLGDKTTRRISRVAVGGLIIMLVLPLMVHYLTDRALASRGYAVCAERSTQWLFVRSIAYALPRQC